MALLAIMSRAGAQAVVELRVNSFGERISAVAGCWYPLFVTLEYAGPAGEGLLVVRNVRQGTRWVTPVALSPRTSQRLEVYGFQREEGRDPIEVELVRDGQPIAVRQLTLEAVAIAGRSLRVLLLGDAALSSFCDGRALGRHLGEEQIEVLRHDPREALPERVEGYDGLGLVIASGYPLDRATPRARLALLQWVERGGELWWAIDGADPTARIVPELRAVLPVQQLEEGLLTSLEPLAVQLLADPPSSVLPTSSFRYACGTPLAGAVVRVVDEQARALIADRRFGLGRLGFCGIDLARPPLVQWEARSRMIAMLIRMNRVRQPARQLGPALQRLLHERLPVRALWIWTALMLGYALLLSLGGYVLMRRRRRQRSAVLVLPAVLVLGSVAVLVLAQGMSQWATWRTVTVSWQYGGDTQAHELAFLLGVAPDAGEFSVTGTGSLLDLAPLAGGPSAELPSVSEQLGDRVTVRGLSMFRASSHPLQMLVHAERQAPAASLELVPDATDPDVLRVVGQLTGLQTDIALLVWQDYTGVMRGQANNERQIDVRLDRTLDSALKQLIPGIDIETGLVLELPRLAEAEPAVDLIYVERQAPSPLRLEPAWHRDRDIVLRIVRLPLARRVAIAITPTEYARVERNYFIDQQLASEERLSRFEQLDKSWRVELVPGDLGRVKLSLLARLKKPARALQDGAVLLEVEHRQQGNWLALRVDEQGRAPLPGDAREWLSPWGLLRARLRVNEQSATPWFEEDDLLLEVELAPR
jgi:hypothetical protein